jgi:DNA-directed RNA polymerase specialized sigma24 family protein
MSTDDRFRGVDWELVLAKLTLRARQLFASAKAKGYGNALARSCTDPDDLARTVIAAVLENESVKFKPSKGASLTTFLSQVLERRFIGLLRQGGRHNSRLKTLDGTSKPDSEFSTEPGVIRDIGDGGQVGKVIHLRAAALHAVNGDKKLEEYVTAAFDCGASKRADQAELLQVAPSEITNLRKKFHRLLKLEVENGNDDLGSEE